MSKLDSVLIWFASVILAAHAGILVATAVGAVLEAVLEACSR